MSEHSLVYETPINSTNTVASPSATALLLLRQITRERQVEQDTILGVHGQGGRQRSTDSPPSYNGSEQGMLPGAQLALRILLSSLAPSFCSSLAFK